MWPNFIKIALLVLKISGGFDHSNFLDIIQFLLYIFWFHKEQLSSLIMEPNFVFVQPFYGVLPIATHLSVE